MDSVPPKGKLKSYGLIWIASAFYMPFILEWLYMKVDSCDIWYIDFILFRFEKDFFSRETNCYGLVLLAFDRAAFVLFLVLGIPASPYIFRRVKNTSRNVYLGAIKAGPNMLKGLSVLIIMFLAFASYSYWTVSVVASGEDEIDKAGVYFSLMSSMMSALFMLVCFEPIIYCIANILYLKKIQQ